MIELPWTFIPHLARITVHDDDRGLRSDADGKADTQAVPDALAPAPRPVRRSRKSAPRQGFHDREGSYTRNGDKILRDHEWRPESEVGVLPGAGVTICRVRPEPRIIVGPKHPGPWPGHEADSCFPIQYHSLFRGLRVHDKRGC